MLTLCESDILLGCRAEDWRSALDLAAESLVGAELTEPAYREGLLSRETQSSTYLGNGIAIPHGTPESRTHVLRTGVRVLQFPGGIEWHDGQRVHVLVTIAAQNDEHLDILRQLTHVLDRDDVAERLANADDAGEVVALLSRVPVEARLDADTLCLGVPARDIRELALAGAARLRQAGCVEDGFIAEIAGSMPRRLGQGAWLAMARRDVSVPALSLATPATALEVQGEGVNGVFCLAAREDAHLGLLERIANLLEGGELETLRRGDAETVLARLVGEAAAAHTQRVRVLNAHGLHARPAKQLVQVAREQAVPIRVRLAEGGAEPVSATSLTKVIGLGARRGQWLVFSAEGEDAEQALAAIDKAVADGLGEAVEPFDDSRESVQAAVTTDEEDAPQPLPEDTAYQAVAASPGLAIAPVFVMRMPRFDYPELAEDPAAETQRLEAAVREGGEQLAALARSARGGEVAEILSMHEEMLDDPELLQAAREGIQEGRSAEAAWWEAIDTAARAQEMLADRLLAERAADLRDVGRRVLGRLCDVTLPEPPTHPYILVMDDVGPSDVARLDTERVRGLLTARGGATAHSAILARALGIPAVVGVGERILSLENGTPLILDGERGQVVPAPGEERRQRAERRLADRQRREREAWEARFEPARTRDGHRVEVAANLGNTAHAADAVSRGAEGVGLLRTEFLFMAHAEAPDLDTQMAEYREALDALDGRPLVARTLDVGGDKPLPYWPVPQEDNPFLGLRGIRLALTRPGVLETQLEALLRAAIGRPLRIMLPMVKDVAELRTARAMLDRLLAEVPEHERSTDVQLGVMIEVPSSALLASSLAVEADFFSVGTNDLTQYALAIDRGHPELSAQADGLHPSVLKLIEMTVEAAHAQGKWVGVCGELASDAAAVPVLVGLGVDELSVSARQVPMVKARLREFDLADARDQARRALTRATADEVRDALEET
ncbi:phosphoenolpyruvate--protein phosphotransferase [Halomonas elongata]|uniref:phosphoenolpyruvate--protein phosphotransferase n=1 Tax=Halomonas elongata (strain ATCC 33173 / DSM 2581 / NBRC 15536 / NCIMB 2198 / 1H9) TaxID=768066 RepID=E1V8C6_HALED|nr:phosphoenolpyruvate--protein phosphotransferase [Halomonas elongata]WBF17325.1 phosphoenolpyruvate--protein phosphotransferase [Halomonas elongata]WPU46161.1 phosphoenolpyruvate--protein phosphotransferase [Halomonas elongata DSM 2581]CBV43582.1 multiphosphoryl transfer protein, fructose-specific [Halomonas elongata DSM 2581]